MEKLILYPIDAYTIYSADNEYTSSEKGLYSSYEVALKKSIGSGWYGSNGEVRKKQNVYQDEVGTLYTAHKIGEFTDIGNKRKDELYASILSKLTDEELNFFKQYEH